MAEFMFPNVAYRATVYRTGVATHSVAVIKKKSRQKDVPPAVSKLNATAQELAVLPATQLTKKMLPIKPKKILPTLLELKSLLVLLSFWLFSTKSWLEFF